MNCDWCLSEQAKFEKIVPELGNSQSYKDLLGSDSRMRQTKQSGRLDYQKISLRRKSDLFKTNLTFQNTPTARIQSNKPIYRQPIYQSVSYHQLPNSPSMTLPPQRQPPSIPRPISYPSMAITPPPTLKINQRIARKPGVKILFTSSPKQPAIQTFKNQRETINTEGKNFHKQSFNSYDNNKSTIPSQIQPIKVQFQQLGISNIAESNNDLQKLPLLQIRQQQRKTNSNNANTNSIHANNKIINNTKNISTKNKVSRNQEFKGSMSYYGGDKLKNSLAGHLDDEDPNRRNSLARSMKAMGHLQDIKCKKTQSIADANDEDSMDEFSEVVIGSRNVMQKQNKLTNSETQISDRMQKIATQNKRQIIWENSRKESLSEL